MTTLSELHKQEESALLRLGEYCKANGITYKTEITLGGIFVSIYYEHGQNIRSKVIKAILDMPFELVFIGITPEKHPCIYFELDRTRL